jgi:hypothetical protein
MGGAPSRHVLGIGMTNLDGSVDDGLEEHLKAGGTGSHYAWDHFGTLHWDAGREMFAEEVKVHHVSQGLRYAATLEELMRVVNEEFGWG